MPKYKGNMQITALYERLSKDDDQQGESNSITNQKKYLEDYAIKNGFTHIKHFTDDGYTGRNFNRPGFQELLSEVENGNVGTVIVKDMSRFGRNYLQVGFYTEILFPQKEVRFIAVNNSVDSNNPNDNDFTPILNIMNEFYARDTSNKIKSIFLSRMSDGKRCSGSIPYGYNRLPGDKQTLVVDPVASKVIKHMFELAADGKGPTEIARILTEDKVLIPSAYTLVYHPEQSNRRASPDSCNWSGTTVSEFLGREEYIGNTVLRKSICTNFKTDTRRAAEKDEVFIFQNTHEPIVDKETWDKVQKNRNRKKKRYPMGFFTAQNRFDGMLFCGDCGNRLGFEHHFLKDDKIVFSYKCSSYTKNSKEHSCTCHYISLDTLSQLVLHAIQRVAKKVLLDENQFAQTLQEQWNLVNDDKPKKQREELLKSQRRYDELSRLVQKLYESYIAGDVSERQYKSLMKTYDDEQGELEVKIEQLNEEQKKEKQKPLKIKQFISLIKKYKEPTELTDEILHEFIDRIELFENFENGGKKEMEVVIYYNFIGQFSPEYTPEEIAEAKALAEQKTKEKKQAKIERQRERNRINSEKARAEHEIVAEGHKFVKKVCIRCGKEFWPSNGKQIMCSIQCREDHNRERTRKAYHVNKANPNRYERNEDGSIIIPKKQCVQCGKTYQPTHTQQQYCCKKCSNRASYERSRAEMEVKTDAKDKAQ